MSYLCVLHMFAEQPQSSCGIVLPVAMDTVVILIRCRF
jgi:hypothetical protein